MKLNWRGMQSVRVYVYVCVCKREKERVIISVYAEN